ncbi:hypothetical protein WOLCODRAFT_117013 [Wolfiporia cocos MD-104 SS10]|uniref:F-box domain-containing protein n=1 Tax=Wolfiporia cocos (strain MD-104) TaxID=742152 RepID=A0A2H3JFF6_WOLCO|nr:hypothetical protein WOLCODRAFT_117013 [Wolfiporia cocos MD-104 SS10]
MSTSVQDDSDSLRVSPVDRLPPEILLDIFALCAQDPDDEYILLSLDHVCQYWRSIVLSSPHVWQHVFLKDKHTLAALRMQSSLWLTRSTPLPISIHVALESGDMLLPLLSPLLHHISRWRSCTVRCSDPIQPLDISEYINSSDGSLLQCLDIAMRGASNPDHLPGIAAPRCAFESYPSTRPYVQNDYIMRISVGVLPPPQRITPLYLTTLTVTETLHASTKAGHLLHFLLATPLLERLYFYGVPREDCFDDKSAVLPIVPLLSLQYLVLRCTCALRTILSHIHAPNLEELFLEHTNVDFEVQQDPYASAHEDGDSDDEAHDPSQSPWSDHATGMGLRSLIKRSDPPLRVLQMDYADMRTKDFLWCFNRLQYLQEFYIVASDMSNNVLRMFAPFTPIDSDESTRVRLPRLTMLELYNCQRISGDAVVDVLRRRVQHTDKVADDINICTLSDVAIVDCHDFVIHHAVELTPLLRGRLRLS